MLNAIFGKSKLITLSAILLCVLLPLFAYLQFHWLGELSKQESSRIREKIENTAFNLAFRMNKHFFNIQRLSFAEDSLNNIEDYQNGIIDGVEEWKKGDNYQYLKSIYLLDLKIGKSLRYDEKSKSFYNDSSILNDEEVKKYLNFFKTEYVQGFPNTIQNKFSLYISPLDNSLKPDRFIIFQLNGYYLIDNVIKNEMEELSSRYLNDLNGIAIISNKDLSVIYSNYAFDKYKQWRESKIPFGILPPRMPHFDKMDKHFKDGMFEGGERKKPENLDSNNKLSRDRFSRNPEFFEKIPDYLKPYSLVIDVKSEGFNFDKYKNLIISFIILIILGVICIFFLMIALKTQKIASQQLFFFAGLPHELRTPLSVIRTASQNLNDGIINDEKKTKKYGGLILNEIDKLWAMIENALMYAGIQSQQRVFTFVICDIQDLIKKALDLSRDSINKSSIDLKINISENLPNIKADQKAFVIALENLISNASKFSKPNGIIDIIAEQKKKYIEISIKDYGVGISKKEISKIFKPFYRSKDAYKLNIQGSGIGLSIAKNILDAHRAKIRVESEINKWTCFKILIPIK